MAAPCTSSEKAVVINSLLALVLLKVTHTVLSNFCDHVTIVFVCAKYHIMCCCKLVTMANLARTGIMVN